MSPPPRLNPAQAEVHRLGLLESGFSVVLELPTGSGKTWLAEQAMARVVARGQRALYVTPLRALAAERGEAWRRQHPETTVGVFSGPATSWPVPFEAAQVLIMTPERLDVCTRHYRRHLAWMAQVSLVVVDELHLLADPRRGPRLEGALTRWRRLNPFAPLVGLSATLGNAPELARWWGGVAHRSEWRAVPLTWTVCPFERADDKPAHLRETVTRAVSGGGQSLVFVQSRRRAEALAEELDQGGLRASAHHAGLDTVSRQAVEAGFRAGELDAVVATSTLEMGLNLPARQVVLYDLQRFDGRRFVPLPVASVHQQAGRAGRQGLDAAGEAVLFVPAWDRRASDYPRRPVEPVVSQLGAPRAVAEQVVAEVSSGLCRTEAQVSRALGGSLAAAQGFELAVPAVVTEMIDGGLLEQGDGRLRATRLGHVASRHLLSPQTVRGLARALTDPRMEAATFFDLWLLALAQPDAAPLHRVRHEALGGLAAQLRTIPSSWLRGSHAEVLARLETLSAAPLRTVATACLLRSWVETGDVEAVASRHGCYPFEVRGWVQRTGRVLAALAALAPAREGPAGDGPGLAARVVALQKMTAYGLDTAAVGLTVLDGLGGALARRLAAAGWGDLEALAAASPEEVGAVPGVSSPRATGWIAAAQEALGDWSADFDEVLSADARRAPVAQPLTVSWPEGVDAYRLRRALELSVVEARDGAYVVSGGLEPHQVGAACDCTDHARGHRCKHLLAVALRAGDATLHGLASALRGEASGPFNLHALWFAQEP